MKRNEMNKKILLAGGFKNLNSTSYINCTLQIFLHFRPFIEQIRIQNPSKSDENYSLILSLQNLIKKLEITDTSLSTDSIISAMRIDPKISNTINNFFLFFRFSVSFNIIKFDFETCKNSINEEINLFIQNSDNFEINDLNNNFMYIHLQPNNQQIINVNYDLSILDFSFTLYAVVQTILSPTSHNHYFVTIRDKDGWVVYNDTAVTNIDNFQFENSLNSVITPIEILIYVKNINDCRIIRKPASIQSTFIGLKRPLDNINEDNSHEDDGNYERETTHEDIDSIIRRNDSSDDDCCEIPFASRHNPPQSIFSGHNNHISTPFIEVSNESTDEETRPIIIRRPSRLIDSDPHRNRYKRPIKSSSSSSSEEDEDDDNKDIRVEFFDASKMQFLQEVNNFKIPKFVSSQKLKSLKKKIEKNASIEVKYTILEKDHEFSNPKGGLYDTFSTDFIEEEEDRKVAIFELKNMNNFDIEKIKNCETCYILFSIPDLHDLQFNGQFVIDQTFEDIINYANVFMNQIAHYDSMYKIYLKYENGYFDVSKYKKIRDIQQLINEDQLHFVINLNLTKRDIYSIKIPIYSIKPQFRKISDIHFLCNIDDNCQSIIEHCIDEHIFDNPIIVQYVDDIHKFKEIKASEKAFHLINQPNIRIQQRQRGDDKVVFIYEDEPFLFELRPNMSQDILFSEISYYLSLNSPFTLDFMDVNNELVDINNNFLENYRKNLYSYVIIHG